MQVTYVEPYFDEWEDKERTSVYERSFNIRMSLLLIVFGKQLPPEIILGRFAFNTPFTSSGKAHGDVTEQYMRKTILTSMECFPYVKKRSKVVKLDTVPVIIIDIKVAAF